MKKFLAIFIIFLFVSASIVSGINIKLKNTTIPKSNGSVNTLNVGSSSSGLVAHWDFDEGTGDVLHDVSGNGNDGTINGASWINGISGYALNFDGDDDYIIRNPINNFPTTQITVSFWMKTEDTEHEGCPISYASSSASNDFTIGNYCDFSIAIGDEAAIGTGVSANDGVWHNIVITWNSNNGQVELYKDGIVAFTSTIFTGGSMTPGGSFVIGGDQDCVGGCWQDYQFFIGIIDEVRIYNRALSEDEIQYLYNNPGVGDIVYVDDDYDSSTSGWGIDHFGKIQDGIDAVNVGGTVFVYNGTYYENVVIDKSINLIGETEDITIIDGGGNGDVVYVPADYVKITEFTIHNSGTGYRASGIKTESNFNCFCYNNVSNNKYGIYLDYYSNDNTIIGNNVSNNKNGIWIDHDTSNNLVYHNNLFNLYNGYSKGSNIWYNSTLQEGNYWNDYTGEDNDSDGIGDTPYYIPYGDAQDCYPLIYPWHPTHPDTVYVDDDYDINTSGFGYDKFNRIQYGINEVEGSTVYVYNGTYFENLIVDKTINLIGEDKNNTIIDGGESGDVVSISANYVNFTNFNISNCGNNWGDAAIYAISNYNKFYNNIIQNSNPGTFGIYLDDISINNIITNNHISGYTENGIYLRDGSNYNLISENELSENHDGIQIYDVSENIISKNIIHNNSDDGIGVSGTSNNNSIYFNLVENNFDTGITCGFNTNDNLIYHNNIRFNFQNGYDDSLNFWDNGYPSGGNYWDDYTGTDSDGDGIGDTPYPIPGGDNQDNYPLITLFGPPHADFNYTIDDKNVLFNASLSYDYNGEIVSYKWDFGDETTGNGIVVSHKYEEYGTYTVILTVTDDDSLSDNISKDVTVVDELPPVISNLQVRPPVQIPGGYVNISATVKDDSGLDDVRVIIRYPDDSIENISILQNKIGDTYYCNKTYDMIGLYECHIWSIDINGNSATSGTVHFEITEEFICDADGPYSGWVDESIQFYGYAINGFPPYSWHWDFGDTQSSDEQNPTHAYSETGNYTVTLTVTDSEENEVSDITWAFIVDLPVPPPPEIYGPQSGKVGVEYDYYFLIPYVEYCDALRLRVDWGDTGPGKWHGPYEVGEVVTLNHTWRKQGDYTIRAQVMDVFGTESDWAKLTVTMPRSRAINTLFFRLLENHPFLYQLLQLLFQRFGL